VERLIFDESHEIFRASARRFFETEIGPHAARWREQGFVDREAFRKAGEAGLLLVWADPQYGGAGISDFRYEQILVEENARWGDQCFYATLHSRLVGPYLGQLGNEEQKARLLPGAVRGERILGIAMTEPDAGSDLAGMRTRAVPDGNDWVLTGTKTYISNGQIGDCFVVAARTDPERSHGIGLFVVEEGMAGFRRGRRLKKIGLHAQDTSELFFDGVRVPAVNVLGDPLQGFGYLKRFLAEERLVGAVMYVANATIAFDLTLDWVQQRRMFGRPLGAFQNTRFKMAQMRAEIDALQAFVDHCVTLHNAGRLGVELAAKAKLLCSELEGRVTDECVQLHGGAGYMEEYRIARMYTDARVSRIYAGSSEVMREIIARSIGLDERKMS
jgi:acyl-CoA dehydrogenase